MKTKKIKNLSEIILYGLLIIIGIIVMTFPSFGLINPPYYLGSLFFISAFFTTIAYFIYRKENDYKLLFDALISILVGTFLFITTNNNVPFIMGTAIMIFTLLTIVNNGVIVYKAKEKKNYMWVIKFITTFIFALLGLLTIINLYVELSVQTLIIGYFFIALGTISMVEPILMYFSSEEKVSKVIKAILHEELEIQVVKKEKTKKRNAK